MICSTPTIVASAKFLIKTYNREANNTHTCLKAGLCPICGKVLELATKKVIVSADKIKILFWFFTLEKERVKEETLIVCPNKCELGMYAYPGCMVYETCINSEIKDCHLYNYGDDDGEF